MKINLKKMQEKMFHTPHDFKVFCTALENHLKATQVNFRGEPYNWAWHVEFEGLNLVVTSEDNRQSGIRPRLIFKRLYE